MRLVRVRRKRPEIHPGMCPRSKRRARVHAQTFHRETARVQNGAGRWAQDVQCLRNPDSVERAVTRNCRRFGETREKRETHFRRWSRERGDRNTRRGFPTSAGPLASCQVRLEMGLLWQEMVSPVQDLKVDLVVKSRPSRHGQDSKVASGLVGVAVAFTGSRRGVPV